MANNGHATLPVGTDADLFQAAKTAAADGRPDDMLQALSASMFLDGLVRMHRKRWGQRLPASEIGTYVDSTHIAAGESAPPSGGLAAAATGSIIAARRRRGRGGVRRPVAAPRRRSGAAGR